MFSTAFYAVFSVVVYAYVGNTVASPALFSLPPTWSKVAFAVGMVNFLMYALLLRLTENSRPR